LNTPEHLEGGQTIEGEHGALHFSVRFPPARTPEVRALKPGDALDVSGAISGWERLYRQAIIDVE
jgi:hypothetical protein